MISNAQLTPVLPVVDVSRAAGFYRDRLGLKDAGEDPGGNHLVQTGSGTLIRAWRYLRKHPDGVGTLVFEVHDIDNEIKDLESRGVGFYDYDLPNLKTKDHVAEMGAEKAAWFADTEGNILCLHEVTADMR